ncbi:hypothetical protein L211DRAFT_427320 [Terfezia boudieri ATCC MYA-4762]|uniref:Uncharacterized protein n=1 Tax=Terfezia boudieri ATCC MYA-4762 TaxID=1051890 RepID=A0A3N4LFK4_9PEZI|nr:hypothetical protein L211DRAFT_427320 [Terfezia boudieri ATCC MYA-4762]
MEPSPESLKSKLGLCGPEGVIAPASPYSTCICGSNLMRCTVPSCELKLHGTWQSGLLFDLQPRETEEPSPPQTNISNAISCGQVIAPRANLPSQLCTLNTISPCLARTIPEDATSVTSALNCPPLTACDTGTPHSHIHTYIAFSKSGTCTLISDFDGHTNYPPACLTD